MKSPISLPRTVVVIGLVSLLNDFASEMVIPLVPLLLSTSLGAGASVLGLIEGTAEAVSNLLKLWAGRHSDLHNRRRKPYVIFGYLLSNLVRPLIGFSTSWLSVLTVRVTDRIGKGIRTAPRDALVADVIDNNIAGRAYGFIRALDNGGAVLGALAAAAIVYFGTDRLDIVIALSAIPGMAAVSLIALGIKETPRTRAAIATNSPLVWRSLSIQARTYLVTIALFMLGRIPETFVLLRGHEVGMSTVELLLLWAAMHIVKVVINEQAGQQTDRIGRRPLILAGWSIYAITLLALAFAQTPSMLWILSLGLGSYFGLTEGAERAFVRDLSEPEQHGTAFGWFHMTAGLAAIPAGLLLGGLWTLFGAQTAFIVSGTLTAIATIGFWRLVR